MAIKALGGLLFVGLILGTAELVTLLTPETGWRIILYGFAVFFLWGPISVGFIFLLKKILRRRCRHCGFRSLEYDPGPHSLIVDPPPPEWFETEFWYCNKCGASAKRVRGTWNYDPTSTRGQ